MKTVVLKFGGTSVGSIDRIKKVCKIIASYKKKKYKVVVISSAMSGVTNELVNKSKSISNNFDLAELFYDIHIIANYALITLISLHFLAVIAHKILFKENLLKKIL